MLKLYVDSVIRALDNAERKRLTTAAKHLRKKMKQNVAKRYVSRPGQFPGKSSGDLQKGIMYQFIDLGDAVLVGVGPPAYEAHMLEFGTQQRTVKSYMGRSGVKVSVGRVLPRPFVFPTFNEEAPAVERILGNPWV